MPRKTKEPQGDKVALLSEAREKKQKRESEQRNAIKIDKVDRQLLIGFGSQEREIERIAAPLKAEINEFLTGLQEKYKIKIGETHGIDVDKGEFVPLPSKPEAPPETPVQPTA